MLLEVVLEGGGGGGRGCAFPGRVLERVCVRRVSVSVLEKALLESGLLGMC